MVDGRFVPLPSRQASCHNEGLSGADAVASWHGIGMATVVNVAEKGCFPLFCIGDVHAEIKSVEAEATKCMLHMAR